MKLRLVGMIAGLFTFSLAFAAETGVQRLEQFNANVDGFEAQFEQTIVDENNKLLEKATGKMYLLRPGKFRWEYKKPYAQLIVSNGNKIWLFDQDLEQVTIKTLQEGIGDTPAMLLTRKRGLEDDFDIKELGVKQEKLWVQLTPKNNSINFDRIYLAFDMQSLKIMELLDKLGQVTRITFTGVKINPGISPALFQFTPPPDVDIIGADG